MTIPNGVFPAVALSNGSGLLAVRQGDPRVPGWIVVYRFAQSNPEALTETWRSSLPAGSPCFPNLSVLDGLTWLAFHDGSRQWLRNMATGDEQSFYGLSNPSAFGGGYFAYTDPRQPYKVYRVNLRTGEVDQPRLGAPTGLSRILDDGTVRTIDEDRFALAGATIPSFAGPLAVGEGHDGGAFWKYGTAPEGTIWFPLDSFTPKCAADGDVLAITTAGSGSVRLFCGSLAQLIAASAPPIQKEPGPIVNVPPSNPIPIPEPTPMPTPTGSGTSASDPRVTSSLDPAYLTAAILASYAGTHGGAVEPASDFDYWFGLASHPGQYSDGIWRIGWNAYWEARMEPTNTGSASPALGDQPARYLPGGTPTPAPGPTPVPTPGADLSSILKRLEVLEANQARPLHVALKSSRGHYLRDDWADSFGKFDRTEAGDGETYTLEPK